MLFGVVLGWIALQMIRRTEHYQVEIMVTLALAMSGYAIAAHAHVSAPIAIVIAGLLIGSYGRTSAMHEATAHRLDDFWELVDEVLNAVLFVLIGLEVLVIQVSGDLILAGLIAIPLTLAARWVSIAFPIRLMRRSRTFEPGVVPILTWGGLRGGISVALVLSLPEGEIGDILLTVTYFVVVFSVLVQGLTIGALVRAVAARGKREPDRAGAETATLTSTEASLNRACPWINAKARPVLNADASSNLKPRFGGQTCGGKRRIARKTTCVTISWAKQWRRGRDSNPR